MRSASEIPSRPQAKYTALKQKGLKGGALQDLSKKFHREGEKGVIQQIQINDQDFDIVLFTSKSMENIANFCSNDMQVVVSSRNRRYQIFRDSSFQISALFQSH